MFSMLVKGGLRMVRVAKERFRYSRLDNTDILQVGKKIWFESTVANKLWMKVPEEIRRKIYDEVEPDVIVGRD